MDAFARWFRTISLLAALLSCVATVTAQAAGSTINPLGIKFTYNIRWIDVEKATFGVSMQARATSTYDSSTRWSLLVRYAENANTNITHISPGWQLGKYDHSTWAVMTSSSPFDELDFTGETSGKMDLEDTVMRLAVPASVILVPQTVPTSRSVGYTMQVDSDYTVNQGINLAEVPKSAFGTWASLPSVTSLVDLNPPVETTKAKVQTAKATQTSNGETASATIEETAGTETPQSNDQQKAAQETNNTSETYLPPLKYIKGDPNYDVETDPLGTQLAAPLTGLYLVSAILGIGIIAHALGTARRYAFRRQYFQSLKQSKAGYFSA